MVEAPAGEERHAAGERGRGSDRGDYRAVRSGHDLYEDGMTPVEDADDAPLGYAATTCPPAGLLEPLPPAHAEDEDLAGYEGDE